MKVKKGNGISTRNNKKRRHLIYSLSIMNGDYWFVIVNVVQVRFLMC